MSNRTVKQIFNCGLMFNCSIVQKGDLCLLCLKTVANKKESKMKNIVIYPGTFDPITYGHIDVIKRVCSMFDRVIVGVGENPDKKSLFSLDERIEIVQIVVKDISNIKVEGFKGLVIDFAKKKKAKIIVRGLRVFSDFEYELQMSLTNRNLAPDIETVCIMPDEKYFYISSRLINQVASLGGDISKFVPPFVEKRLREKFLKLTAGR